MQDRETRTFFHAMLDDRGVVCVRGMEAKAFLQGLITNDVLALNPGEGRYAALLTPQGKIIVDFLVAEAPAENGSLLYLDCPRSLASDFVKQLAIYRLRAKIDLEDASERLRVCAAWGEAADAWQPNDALASFRDPRAPDLGRRFIVPATSKPMEGGVDAAFYEAHRIALGVPNGGIDFAFGETFPHDANLDLLHGIDFNKGCYIGQEVVSRVEHRGTARKRVVRVHFAGTAPAPGTEITAGEIAVGTMGSASDRVGLVMIRTDRAEEAIAAKVPLMAADLALTLAPAG